MGKLGPVLPSPEWGFPSQIAAADKDLADVNGNKDGLWDNESLAASTPAFSLTDAQPLVSRLLSGLQAASAGPDATQRLNAFVAERKAAWGTPIVTPQIASQLKNPQLFEAQKAIALTRLGRTPSEVTETFVRAAGSVDGQAIAPRQIFTQNFSPTTVPNGRVVVVSPGFQETGRNFYEQIQKMNALGFDVVVMDQQWAGQSGGSPGGLDRGFGVARDVAAVAAYAGRLAADRYGADGKVVLFGNSMGAGPGVLGAMTLNDNGLIQLDGEQMPKGCDAVLQAPFLGPSPSVVNTLIGAASHIPFIDALAAPAAGMPVLTKDPIAAQKGAQTAVSDDVRAQLKTMTQAQPDINAILDRIANGQKPHGQIAIVQTQNDSLANPALVQNLASMLGDRATYTMLPGSDHVLEQSPSEQLAGIEALQSLP